jgi:hypothetical protein
MWLELKYITFFHSVVRVKIYILEINLDRYFFLLQMSASFVYCMEARSNATQ